MDTQRRWGTPTFWLITAVAAISTAAFAISYQGLHQVAVDARVASPWLWPLIVDAVGVVAAGAAWWVRRRGHPVHGARTALWVTTGWSVSCQMVTVPPGPNGAVTWFDRAVHAWAPTMVLGTVELVLWVLSVACAPERVHTPTVPPPAAPKQPGVVTGEEWAPLPSTFALGRPGRPAAGATPSEIDEAARLLLERGEPVNGNTLAAWFNVDGSTGRRYRQGWEKRHPQLKGS